MGRMTDKPWIDAAEVDALAARYTSLSRARIELVLEAFWPVKDDVEAALLEAVALQQRSSSESLDYTRAAYAGAPTPPSIISTSSRPGWRNW